MLYTYSQSNLSGQLNVILSGEFEVTSSDLIQMVGILKLELAKGLRYLSIAKQLQIQYANPGYTEAILFFGGASAACIDCAILSFTKVVDSQDKLGFEALMRSFQNNLSVFDSATAEKIKTDIEYHRKDFENLRPFVKELKQKWRNEVIAHTSLKFINEDGYMRNQPPVNMVQLERYYRKLYDMVGVYGRYLDVDTAPLDLVSQQIEDDVNYLVGLLNAAKNSIQ